MKNNKSVRTKSKINVARDLDNTKREMVFAAKTLFLRSQTAILLFDKRTKTLMMSKSRNGITARLSLYSSFATTTTATFHVYRSSLQNASLQCFEDAALRLHIAVIAGGKQIK